MTAMRVCLGCKVDQPLTNFYRGKGRDGYRTRCKSCTKAGNGAWAKANRPKMNAAKDRYRSTAKGQTTEAAYRAAYRPRARTMNAAYYQANKPAYRAAWRAYKASKTRATVGPVNEALVLASRPDCYLCGQLLSGKVHLDHIIPLARGGAHCMGNLLPTHESCNTRKSDRLLVELPWYSGQLSLGATTWMVTA